MIKASIDLQDLRRKIYLKAKSDKTWRFWGLYVHTCKMETLQTAYRDVSESPGRNESERTGGPESEKPRRPSPLP